MIIEHLFEFGEMYEMRGLVEDIFKTRVGGKPVSVAVIVPERYTRLFLMEFISFCDRGECLIGRGDSIIKITSDNSVYCSPINEIIDENILKADYHLIHGDCKYSSGAMLEGDNISLFEVDL